MKVTYTQTVTAGDKTITRTAEADEVPYSDIEKVLAQLRVMVENAIKQESEGDLLDGPSQTTWFYADNNGNRISLDEYAAHVADATP